ncbi:cytochrome c [Dyella sp.]|uniref:c-type cytochrome n=1 Tax=Dyella sp. TaxID=1869338 RepID=UPI003216CE5B
MLLRRLCLLALLIALPAGAAELKIDLGHGVQTLDSRQLAARPDTRGIEIPQDVAYHRAMRYRAVPLKALLAGAAAGDHLQFVASDGFAAEVPAALILDDHVLDGHGAQAWLAVEDPGQPWPALPGKSQSAGPFYVVWTQPEAGGINPEQWPYQLASIRKLDAVAARFPAMAPDPKLAAASPERRGFEVFQRICLACHTLNGQGDARLGPDLNVPYNPTEYLRADLLRAYVRNPQSLRHWPQAKMPGFDAKVLGDADLDALLAYLRHMAGRKHGP